jgi:mono/diheme cytochrome c family protein
MTTTPGPPGAPTPSGDGLLAWLIGGLAVGLVLLAGVLVAYKVGYDNGRDSVDAAPAATQPAETEPTETQPTETRAEAPDGAAVFAEAGCNSCHTLSAAGASGTIGPNLDELRPTEEQVVAVVTNGSGAMPAFAGQLDTAEIEAVAAYVASSAGG